MSAQAASRHFPIVGGNIYAVLDRAASSFSDHVAVISGDESITYSDLQRKVLNAAMELEELGAEPGQRVMSLAANCAELLVLYFASAYVGCISVPLNTMLLADEIEHLVSRVEPALFFSHSKYSGKAHEATRTSSLTVRDIEGDDLWTAGRVNRECRGFGYYTGDGPSTIVFTSGSTAGPKGCMKSHSNLLWAAINHHLSWPRTAEDRELFVIPLAGIGFANFVLGGMLVGSSIVLEPFDAPATLNAMERYRTTTTFLAATMLDSLLYEEERSGPRDLSAMRQIQLSYEMSQSLRERIAKRFPGIVHYSYGSTEGGMSSAREPHRFLDDPTCVGIPNGLDSFGIAGEEGQLLEAGEKGEIVITGPDVMLGYLNDPEATAEALSDGWLRTGDLGYLDAGGALHYVGRFKDMIKSGGVSIASVEVEECLTSHESVRDAAVFGVPDEHWGEAVYAVVELLPGRNVEVDELEELCRSRLAAYKSPKSIVIVDSLPRNPGGKVAKGTLREAYSKDEQNLISGEAGGQS